MEKNEKTHKLLRVYNWVFSAACILGVLFIMVQATATGMLYLLVFSAVLIVSYTLPAILLYPGESEIFGRTISIDKENKFIYKISILANIVFLLIGIIIILFAFFKGQYPASFFGFLFLLLSYFNIKALMPISKELD